MSIKQDHIGDSNKMVSSIEWLQAIELERDLTLADWNKAKAMHREEHGQTWDKSLDNLKARGMNEMRAYTDFDNYYNETFGQEHEKI